MKRSIVFALVITLLAACSTKEIDFQTPVQDDVVFYASFEQPTEEGTRVYANENLLLRWTADDRVSIFNKNDYNRQYRFLGKTGDASGGFSKVDEAEFVTGERIPSVVSVYPYRSGTKISVSEELTVSLPSDQSYSKNTFGLGANTMVAFSSDNFLYFNNVCGYLKLSFYGENIAVSSISIRGNNGERIAGVAHVSLDSSGIPTVSLTEESTNIITLNLKNPVSLGARLEDSSDFWFVIPPLTFSKGFTVTVNDSNGFAYAIETSHKITIERSRVSSMSPFAVNQGSIAAMEDASFFQYCLDNFDLNKDGYISRFEARKVEKISISNKNIYSLKGIEYFDNLIELYCGQNSIKSIDVSKNPLLTILCCANMSSLYSLVLGNNSALKVLQCFATKLSKLDLSSCTALTELICFATKLSKLDLSSCTALTYLDCSISSLQSLEISNCTVLRTLICEDTGIKELDVSKLTLLQSLSCFSNKLTSLDVSNCPELKSLHCDGNKLKYLDVSKCTGLTLLSCSNNQLTSLDLSKCKAIRELYCAKNRLTELNIFGCSKLMRINCSNNQIANLYISDCTELYAFWCENNKLTYLDVSENSHLDTFYCNDNPLLTEIWLKSGQSIRDFKYDQNIATVLYK